MPPTHRSTAMPRFFRDLGDIKLWVNYGVAGVVLWIILTQIVIPNNRNQESYQERQFSSQEKFRDTIVDVNKEQAAATKELAKLHIVIADTLSRIERAEAEQLKREEAMIRILENIEAKRAIP